MSSRVKRSEASLRRGITRVLRVKGTPNRVKRAMKKLLEQEQKKGS